MRLTHRHRNQRRQVPRIAISQAEITADLHYPAGEPGQGKRGPAAARGTRAR